MFDLGRTAAEVTSAPRRDDHRTGDPAIFWGAGGIVPGVSMTPRKRGLNP